MSGLTAHIINHTHWDREWFLTSVYTNRWIGGLIDKISLLVGANPDFRYFLDGQTLVIEDLFQIAPHYQELVERLVRGGSLVIGPYYCQPDWRLTGGEALLRNLLYGRQDMLRYGANPDTGWLVDTFGHISQAPQLHRLFGIGSVYVWRGIPQMEAYFHWTGPDESQLFTINLFGGYRNLYGITHAPEIAVARLQAELDKLQAYYPTPDIPLFDGYDLENDPEDPLRFFLDHEAQLPVEISVKESTPAGFAAEIRSRLDGLPALSGELNSGKFGAVFPGTLSTRAYLKVMARDCESTLYRLCEPLAVFALRAGRAYPAEKYEAWSRALLRNSIHDCICGVSIDQVHEKMEYHYREVFEGVLADLHESLAYILSGFAPGKYCVSTNPFHFEGWQVDGERLYAVETQGMGVWQVGEGIPIKVKQRSVDGFTWKNKYYEARVLPDGTLEIGSAILGALLVYEEHGDTYSAEAGPLLGSLHPQGSLFIEQESELHAIIRIDLSFAWDQGRVAASVRLVFDPSPLVRWQVELEPRGVDFRVEIVFETMRKGQIYAGMPFDTVNRSPQDRDLLPRRLDGKLADILIGQRELGVVNTFPFQEFVAISNRSATVAVLVKGLHSYQAAEDGRITVTLLRSVEWLTKTDLQNRVGDAGPFFYVPDARCERIVTHELAFAILESDNGDMQLQALNAGYQNPPLWVETAASGTRTSWEFFQEDLPLSGMFQQNGMILLRLFNPTPYPHHLSQSYTEADVSANTLGPAQIVPPKAVLNLVMPELPAEVSPQLTDPVRLWNPPQWRVGPNRGSPDPVVLQRLKEKIEGLEDETARAAEVIPQVSPRERYHQQHRFYILRRELLEYKLSLRLNEIKLGMNGRLTHNYLFTPDEEVARIGAELNQMRIQRRIYDYIVQVDL